MKKPDKITRLNEEMWDSRAKSYDRQLGFLRRSQKKLISILDLTNQPRLLDIACGTGWALRYADDSAKGKGEFYGIDLSENMIRQGEANLNNYPNVHFQKASAAELPFENNYFDIILCTNAFHHFANPEQAVKEACRVLRPHRKLYILDFTADNFIMKIGDKLSKILEPSHVKMYSTQEFKTLYRNAGMIYLRSQSLFWSSKIHIAEKQL